MGTKDFPNLVLFLKKIASQKHRQLTYNLSTNMLFSLVGFLEFP